MFRGVSILCFDNNHQEKPNNRTNFNPTLSCKIGYLGLLEQRGGESKKKTQILFNISNQEQVFANDSKSHIVDKGISVGKSFH